ncbi:putative GTPase LSG1 [Sugiyamaella lignohabitans]|uniref:Putative GTPase LSG1 n=1 Tax=Sugiyamaella lignohabitans TaxID=796027 RepID=A0A167FC75_9ASCO|nr:putative GTPase LSG1 [Sugiyamaella lignohabitans]ANB15104.1 putative GTPase LSG1 [Sugiyamaella lignohabitans]
MDSGSKEASWVKLRSVTQERALDEFLSTAELADTDFTTERTANIRIIQQGGLTTSASTSAATGGNQYLLSRQQEYELEKIHAENTGKLTVPRRPKWSSEMTNTELDRLEKDSFLEWRRGLAALQENEDLLLTPFERNIEVWRQLWRVIDRSDLVVQIVDGRNPLLFRSVDLEHYVKELDSRKRNLLLINKADLLSLEQRKVWADYFLKNKIRYAFFSAKTSLREVEEAAEKERLEQEKREQKGYDESDEEDDEEEIEDNSADEEKLENEESLEESGNQLEGEQTQQEETEEQSESTTEQEEVKSTESEETLINYKVMRDDPTHILSVDELEALFLSEAPEPLYMPATADKPARLQIGLVGYPNVGKSSSINALIGAKKVSVSSTPGKTKHFQTILLSPNVMLCDCPGLVFPNFASTNGDLVCNGVLPIDQLREVTGPVQLVAQRIPKYFLEAIYGISIFTKPRDEGGSGIPTAEEVLVAYARARGFMRSGQGNPDESRAARYVLKDYVNAKLLYCNPPPTYKPDEPNRGELFNQEIYRLEALPAPRQQQIISALKAADPDVDLSMVDLSKALDGLKFSRHDAVDGVSYASSNLSLAVNSATSNLDRDFFALDNVRGHTTVPFHKKGSVDSNSKKHNKKGKTKKGPKSSGPLSYGGTFGDLY